MQRELEPSKSMVQVSYKTINLRYQNHENFIDKDNLEPNEI